MYNLQNDCLQINIKNPGAELCAISSLKNGREFMWHADPNIWNGYAPNLFPIIGMLKNNTFIYEDKTYNMPKHGFVRQSNQLVLDFQDTTTLTFKMVSNHELFKMYPFYFEYFINYQLIENKIQITYTIKNIDAKTLYFSVGAHPAFKCPVYQNEAYDNYSIVFEKPETAQTYLLNLETGLVTSKTKPVIKNGNEIQLHHNLFNEDALVFKDLKSRKATLKSKTYGDILSVYYDDFPYLGIWAKPNANYVCIEPWQGIADSESATQILKEKEGIIALDANKTHKAVYTIEIDKRHLV